MNSMASLGWQPVFNLPTGIDAPLENHTICLRDGSNRELLVDVVTGGKINVYAADGVGSIRVCFDLCYIV